VFAQLEKSEIRAPFSGVAGLRQISAGAYVTNQQPYCYVETGTAYKN
jgi:multidrug resistance efflux pump